MYHNSPPQIITSNPKSATYLLMDSKILLYPTIMIINDESTPNPKTNYLFSPLDSINIMIYSHDSILLMMYNSSNPMTHITISPLSLIGLLLSLHNDKNLSHKLNAPAMCESKNEIQTTNTILILLKDQTFCILLLL